MKSFLVTFKMPDGVSHSETVDARSVIMAVRIAHDWIVGKGTRLVDATEVICSVIVP